MKFSTEFAFSFVLLLATLITLGNTAPFASRICARFPNLCSSNFAYGSQENSVQNTIANRQNFTSFDDGLSDEEIETMYYCEAFRPTYRIGCEKRQLEFRSRKKRFAGASKVDKYTYDVKTRISVCDHYKEYYRVNCSVNGGENDTVRSYCDLYRELCSTLEEDKRLDDQGIKLERPPGYKPIGARGPDGTTTVTPPPAADTAAPPAADSANAGAAPTTAAPPAAAPPPPAPSLDNFNFKINVPAVFRSKSPSRSRGRRRKTSARTKKQRNRIRMDNPQFCTYFEEKCHRSQAYDSVIDVPNTLCSLFAFTKNSYCPGYGDKLEYRLGCARYRRHCMYNAPQFENIDWAYL